MIKEDGPDCKEILLNKGSVIIRMFFTLRPERIPAMILPAPCVLWMYLCDEQFKIIGVIGNQIPRIGTELVLHILQEIGRSIKMNAPISPQ